MQHPGEAREWLAASVLGFFEGIELDNSLNLVLGVW